MARTWWQFLGRAIVFGTLGLLVYPVVVLAAGLVLPATLLPNIYARFTSSGFLEKRLTEADTTGQVDVLVIGSSMVYRNVDPRVFAKAGLRLFNLGSSSQTHLQTELLLERYLAQMRPSVVFYEVSPTLFAMREGESWINLLQAGTLDQSLVTGALRSNDVRVVNTLVYRLAASATGLWIAPAAPPKVGESYIAGGFTAYNNPSVYPFAAVPIEEQVTHPKQAAAFLRNVAAIKATGAKLKFMCAPLPNDDVRAAAQGDELWYTLVDTSSLLDYRDYAGFTDSVHFQDAFHLNQAGAEEFSRLLVGGLFD